jgi:hypothetical protein
MLSNMESSGTAPDPAHDPASELAGALAARDALAAGVVTPTGHHLVLAAAVGVQVLTLATALTSSGRAVPALVLGGLAVVGLAAAAELLRFRHRNGVQPAGLAGRVLLGTTTTASVGYAAAVAASFLAAARGAWWLAVLCAVAGGAVYALGGYRWLACYRAAPGGHDALTSRLVVAILASLAGVGVVLLLLAGRTAA